MNGRRAVATVVLAVAGLLALSACDGLPGSGSGSSDATGAVGTAGPTAPTPTGTPKPTGTGPARAGDLPNICTLLSRAEVTTLTGRQIVQIDEDAAKPGDTTRYCQWQQSGGRLAIFVSRTTRAQWDVKNPQAVAVPGLGDDAYTLGGHLFVLKGALQVDVYVAGGSDADNLRLEKAAAQAVLPRL